VLAASGEATRLLANEPLAVYQPGTGQGGDDEAGRTAASAAAVLASARRQAPRWRR
jgi:hypothetical protein